MKPVCVVMLLAAWVGSSVQAQQCSGYVRLQWDDVVSHPASVLAAANGLQAGVAAHPESEASLETELRASGHGFTGIVTVQQRNSDQAWVNELYASNGAGAWQFSAGKKIVAWDGGYGFRPNDMVQQEERRTMVSRTEQGRPLLLAEYFHADTAWSIVWVASDALELHGSLRWLEGVDHQVASNPDGLVTHPPWQQVTQHNVTQWLVGGTWTHTSQLSLLAELWQDGNAPSDAQWDDWASRNRQLMTRAASGAPLAAVAGNLAWQAQAFNTSANLRRSNVYGRLSWQHDAWQPALDVPYTPADQGRILTGSLTWQGNRLQVQGGVRRNGGPINAVMAQLPTPNVVICYL